MPVLVLAGGLMGRSGSLMWGGIEREIGAGFRLTGGWGPLMVSMDNR